jgi:hypothetical protein
MLQIVSRLPALLAAILAPSMAIAADWASETAPTFGSYCLSASHDFATLDRRTSEAKFEVILDRTVPFGTGQSIRQKEWLVPGPSGSFMLSATDAVNGDTHVVGCGISVLDAKGPDMERALSADNRLGPPAQRNDPAPGGGVTIWWKANLGPTAPHETIEVMLAYNLPGITGVTVNLIDKTQTGH